MHTNKTKYLNEIIDMRRQVLDPRLPLLPLWRYRILHQLSLTLIICSQIRDVNESNSRVQVLVRIPNMETRTQLALISASTPSNEYSFVSNEYEYSFDSTSTSSNEYSFVSDEYSFVLDEYSFVSDEYSCISLDTRVSITM